MCIPSVTDVAFALKVRNPKHFTLVTPTSSADAGRVIRFPHLSPQPVYGTDYTLRQTASDTLTLTYKSAFLQRHEWGNGNIGAEITFISTDGRVFGDRFNLNIRADSAPVLENAGIGKTTVGSDNYYVLLFRVKEMDATAAAGTPPVAQLRHKDLNGGKLIVTKGSGSPVEIPLTFNSGNTDFETGANLLEATDVDGISLPLSTAQDWILRLKTDVKIGDPETPYFVSVTDTQGCSSAVVEARTSRTAVLKLKQNFNSTDAAFHCISTADKAYVSEDIISDAAQYTNTNPLVIYPAGTSPSVKLELTAPPGAAVKYKLDNGAVLPATSSAQAEITVAGSTPVHTLEVWTVMGAITSPSVTVHIKVADAVSTYSQLKNVVQHTPENGTEQYKYNYSTPLNIHIGSGLTASANTEIAITGGKKLKLSSLPAGNVHTVNANNSGRIFKVSWPGTELTLEDIKLTDGNTADGIGGAVHVETGGKLVLKGKTVITPSTGGDENTPGKNDVYLANGASIKVDGALAAAEPIVARITPANYIEGRQVLTGNITAGTSPNENYKRFRVTPQTSPAQEWKIDNTGKLKKAAGVINGSEGGAWSRLKAAVVAAQDGDTIKINGTITATNGGSGDNRGVINITKNITIEKADGAPIAVLNADRSSLVSHAHPIFRVSGGKTLTLKNLTLKGGQGTSGTFGGAINVTGGSSKADITDCTIEDCQADKGGAIGCGRGTTATLNNVTIKKCTAASPSGGGGAIYAQGATVNITGCTLKGNEAGDKGGAICAVKDGAPSNTPTTVTIEGGTIGGTNAADANKATGSDGEGGGIYVSTNCTLTLQNNARVIGNKAGTEGGGVYAFGATVNITNCTLKGNEAKSGGAVYAEKAGSTAPSTVTIKGGTIGGTGTDANKATGLDGKGGGIYVGEGCTLNMQAPASSPTQGVQLIGNTATKGGGGVYASSATVTMTNCTLSGNKADNNNDDGTSGGIYTYQGNLTMTGCTLTGNTARLDGGGVRAESTPVTMTNCTFTGNKARCGGAICASNGGADVTVIGGTIGGMGSGEANEVTDSSQSSGGGIHIGGGATVTLKGSVKVIGNKAPGSAEGAGVYVNCYSTLQMQDSAQVDTNNDVFLQEYSGAAAKIIVDGALTPPGGTAARITPTNYAATRRVLDGSAVGSEHLKFSVTRGGTPPKNWYVGNDGKLTDDPVAIFNTITEAKIKAFEQNMKGGTVSQYNNLKNRLIFYKTNIGNYGVMLITNTPPTSPGATTYNMTFKYKTYVTPMQNGEATVIGTHSFDLDTGTQSTSAVPIENTRDFFLQNSVDIVPKNNATFYVLP